MLVLAVVIRRDSPGPVFFCQQRVGLDGKPFTLIKFRTMSADTDPYGFSPKNAGDPRLTGVGKFFREHSLDELPQLINVVMGQMSLVGPRPLLLWQYQRWTDRQRRRTLVKPGLTGWAQVHGRAALTHEEKIEQDLWYVDNATLLLDLRIIIQTLRVVFSRQATYESRYSSQDQVNSNLADNRTRVSYN